jgi:hypothetical protein
MQHWWNDADKGKLKLLEEDCSTATSSTINLTWTGPRSNPGLRDNTPATYRLGHSTAFWRTKFIRVMHKDWVLTHLCNCSCTVLMYMALWWITHRGQLWLISAMNWIRYAFRKIEQGPCHGSGGYPPASHRGGPGSIPGQSMWDLWWTKWHWDRFSPEFFGFPLSISFHRCSIIILILS